MTDPNYDISCGCTLSGQRAIQLDGDFVGSRRSLFAHIYTSEVIRADTSTTFPNDPPDQGCPDLFQRGHVHHFAQLLCRGDVHLLTNRDEIHDWQFRWLLPLRHSACFWNFFDLAFVLRLKDEETWHSPTRLYYHTAVFCYCFPNTGTLTNRLSCYVLFSPTREKKKRRYTCSHFQQCDYRNNGLLGRWSAGMCKSPLRNLKLWVQQLLSQVWRCFMVQRVLGDNSLKWGNIFWIFPACIWAVTVGTRQ